MSVKYDQLQDHPYKGVTMKLPMSNTYDKDQAAVQQPDSLLAQILTELKEKDDDANKCRAAKSLQQYVVLRSRDFSSEYFKKWMKSLLKNYIWQLINSPIPSEKVGGLIAVVELIEIAHDEFVAEMANYYRFALKTDDSRVLDWAAKAIGHMSRINSTITAECVEFDLMRALEWLQGERQGVKRLAACLILKELAINSPTLFYGYIAQFIDLVWVAIRDANREIRECAIQALEASLQIIRERESRFRLQWYQKMFEESQKGFNKQSNVDIVHASLLTVGVMVVNTGDFLKDRFNGICQTVLKFKEHKDRLIKKSVIEILPKLAAFLPDKFVHNYLENSMNYLLNVLRKDTDCRSSAFLAIGEIAILVKQHMRPYTEAVFAMIRVALTTKVKGLFTNSEAIVCSSHLATGCGNFVIENIRDVLDSMFAGGLNLTLTTSLREISVAIPELSDEIHEKLLDLLSMTLYDRPFDFPGTPFRFRKQEPNVPLPISTAAADSRKSEILKNEEAIALALNILSNFNFDHILLVELLRDGITRYLSDSAVSVRREAAVCCCKLLIGISQKANTFSQILNEVLEKVVSLGISDEDSVTRMSVLSSLEPILDSYLCQSSNLKFLFVALNDELFQIREISLKTICRLSKSNPAHVMPTLRRIFLRLLTQLDSSADNLTREESSRLLGLLTSSVPALVKPYVLPLMQSLMPKLRDPDAGVSSSVLSTVGELAAITGTDMLQHMDELIPLIIESLQDLSSPTKREVAIRTLGKLAENTGYVITPFIKYPKLLDTILTEIVTETTPAIRKEVVRVMGIIGALDPYKHKLNELVLEGRKNDEEGTGKTPKADPTAAMTDNLTPTSEDYYPTISVAALIKILKDPSLVQHHTLVVHTLMFIVKGLGPKSVQFLGYILPQFLQIIKVCEPDFRSTIFQQLGVLVSRVKQHIRNYLPDILNLIHEYWRSTVNLVHVISLIEEISLALADEFRAFVPSLLPFILQLLQLDFDSVKADAVSKALHALGVFGQSLVDYVHLILPVVVRLSEQHHIPKKLKLDALHALNTLCKNFDVANFSSLLIHSLTRVMDSPFPEVRLQSLTVICTIVKQIGRDYLLFEPSVRRVMSRHEVNHPQYESIIVKLKSNEPLERSTSEDRLADSAEGTTDSETDPEEVVESSTGVKKIKLNESNLKRAWEISEGSTKEDWSEWLKQLSVALLRESPSPALRSCISLANDYYPLVKELFNAAFISCWSDMSESYQSELVRTLESALTHPTIPPDILQTLLNLAEFMEQNETPLPIDTKTLSRLAEQCHAYAKALHYKEQEFRNSPTQFIEHLISINNKLQHPEAALGVLIYAQKNHGVQLKESWYEKLQRWDLALQAYEKNAKMYPGAHTGQLPAANQPTASSSMKYGNQTSPPSRSRVHSGSITQMDEPLSVVFGRMRCLQALGEWDQLGKLSQDMWIHSTPSVKMRIAGLGASSAWNLSQWELFTQYVDVIPPTTLDGSFFRAVLSLHEENFGQAQHFIDTARKLVDRELAALVGESYNRSYNLMVKVQQLAELEEITVYKRFPEQRNRILAIWDKRLAGNQRNVDTWQSMLLVRSLVLSPVDNMKSWLKFATLCRKSGRLDLSYKTVVKLLGVDPASQGSQVGLPLKHPRVTYSYLKQLWAIGENQRAYEQLKRFPLVKEDSILQARIFMKLGQWQSMLEGFNSYSLPHIIQALNGAVDYDKNYKKAWSLWALANIEAVSYYEKASNMAPQQVQRMIVNHLVNAINGLFKSISLATDGQHLQDTLRILTLWFNHGATKEVENALNEGFLTVSIDTWLQVIPQLIARIHSPVNTVRKMIHELLNNIGKIHPQALVYPLTVATKSQSTVRVQEARAILDKITKHSPNLVEQAELVSNELVRVSILWIEMWHEALEEASRACFVDNDIPGMLNTLRPLHQMMEKAPETIKESQFQQAYAGELKEANEWCKKWERTHKSNDLNQAWELYTQVFRRIDKLLPQLNSLELNQASSKLIEASNLDLAVPGTYKAGSPIVCIRNFNPLLSIIASKQRPRKLIINGSDGHEYMFLLKGHEDLRQDERVMQLFGLVNNLLNNDYETSKNHLSIQRYSVVPLSPNSGLIGWVTHCDTLHYLIKEYRDAHKIWLNIEHRLMLQMAPDYNNLTLMQKVEAFDYAMENTTGNDLQRILWLRSSDSEVWLDRRTNYTRSLAVMSMVGYILGLGDRHPSNLMLDRHTGTVVHIDFGDCFEVAMHREKYPEKIPFRLTRMLVNAMEVSGIEGTFRFSCENTMRVLRNHKDSLMAVLEAFVYDPIINWRLLTNASPDSTKSDVNTNADRANPNNAADALNKRAYQVINRVNKKLTGKDFQNEVPLDIPEQVQRLINQATSTENLCQCFMGWCPFW